MAPRNTDFAHYPHLTLDEFAEVCHLFDRRYHQAKLGPLRRRWKMRVLSAFGMSFGFGMGQSTYVQIIRPLESTLDHDDLSLDLDKFTFGGGTGDGGKAVTMDRDDGLGMDDEAMVEAEESDHAVLPKSPEPTNIGRVTYEIHLHPTYQVPCLWFTLQGLPADEPAFDMDTVFRRLVPDQFKDALRGAGPIGGISADHHPVTGIPSFFVHPCLLADSMSELDCSKEDYLMAWLGLVGGCVGLWMPREMAV